MRSQFSRRGFLKLLGAFGGFLAAEIVGLVPELQSVKSGNGGGQMERLREERRHWLESKANRNNSFRQLQDYLTGLDFEVQESQVDAVRFQTDELEADMLMLGFSGPGQGASLIFVTVDVQEESIDIPFAWIVDEAVYIIKDGEVTQLPEATERMKNVPRLPQEQLPEGSTHTLFVSPVKADHCPCHNQWSACYSWNSLCAGLTVGCALNPGICPFAIGACISATANCLTAAQCGPAC